MMQSMTPLQAARFLYGFLVASFFSLVVIFAVVVTYYNARRLPWEGVIVHFGFPTPLSAGTCTDVFVPASITAIALFSVVPLAYFRSGRFWVVILCFAAVTLLVGCAVDSDVLVRFDTIQSTDARVAAFNDAYCENTHKDLCWNRRHELAWQQLTLDWDEDSCTQLELRSNHSLVKSVLDNPELDKVHKALCTPPGRTTDDAGSDARVFKVVRKVHVELCDPVAFIGAISWCSSPPMNDSAASPFECFGGLSLRKTYEHWVTALSIYRAALVLFVALGLLTSAVFSFWRFHKK